MTQRFDKEQRKGPIISQPEFLWDSPPNAAKITQFISDPNRFITSIYRRINIATQYSEKYSLAMAIAKRPEASPALLKSLVQEFIPEDVQPTELQKKLKNNLTLTVVGSNKLSLNTPEAREARSWLIHEELQRPDLQAYEEDGIDEGLLGLFIASSLLNESTDSFRASERISWILQGMLRDRLGNLSGKKRKHEMPIMDVINKTPEILFVNPESYQYNLLQNAYKRELFTKIALHGVQRGIAEARAAAQGANSPNKQRMMQGLVQYLEGIDAVRTPSSLKSEITVKGETKPFPSFEQKGFWYEYDNYDNRILAAETGLGKTMTALFTMEKLVERSQRRSAQGVNRVLIIVPSKGRDVWEQEANMVFNDPTNKVFTVKSINDLSDAAMSTSRYVVVTKEMISRRENLEKISQFVKDANFDGAIFDEIDDLSNAETSAAQNAYHITKLVCENWQQRRFLTHPNLMTDPAETPIIGLTATLVKTNVADLNVPIGLLYRIQDKRKGFVPYYEHGDDIWGRKTFSDRFLNRPDLAYMELEGGHRIYRWESAEGVQKMEYRVESIEASAFEEYFYTYLVQHAKTNTFHKIRVLGDALLNQYLAKASARSIMDTIPNFDPEKATDLLRRITHEWVKKNGSQTLNEDRLVELGLGELLVACFLQEAYPKGISTFIQQIPSETTDPELIMLKTLWQPKELTNKYIRLREMIRSTLTWHANGNGTKNRRKVMLVSPVRKENITSLVTPSSRINPEDGSDIAIYSEEELALINHHALIQLLPSFVEGLMDPNDILIIDGNVKGRKKRQEIISQWVSDPDAALLVVTMKTVYQSIDLMLREIEDGQGGVIEGVHKIFLEPPWYWQQLKQMIGRSQRRGQIVPVENTLMVAKDLIDEGKERAVYLTGLLSKMMLSGMIHLTAEEASLIDSLRTGPHVPYHSDLAVRNALVWMKNIGEDEIVKFYEGSSPDNPMRKTMNGEEFALRYYDNGRDIISKPGHIAELITRYIKSHNLYEGTILSIGAGTLALSRRLGRPIHNVDLNSYMMELGLAEVNQFDQSRFEGKYVTGRASRLSEEEFPSGTYDVIDCSNALDFSSLRDFKGSTSPDDSERWRIIRQLHRLLKPGGTVALALPENSVDPAVFQSYIHVLETYGGFTVDRTNSGRGYGIATDTDLTKELGWIIFAQKTGPMQEKNLSLDMLQLLTDSDTWTSNSSRKRLQSTVFQRDYPSSTVFGTYDEYRVIPPDAPRRRRQKNVILGGVQNLEDFPYAEHVIEDAEFNEYVISLLRGNEVQQQFAEEFLIPLYHLTKWSLMESELFIQEVMKQQEAANIYPETPSQLYASVLAAAEREMGLTTSEGGEEDAS